MKFNELIELLIKSKNNEKPGKSAQISMEPSYRQRLTVKNPITDAAVLILLFPINNIPYFSLIKRTVDEKSPHSGQISFPGGRAEPEDIDLFHTALRETSEEIGISSDDIHYIDSLTPLTIPISGYKVHPFMAYVNYHPQWKKNEQEVKYLIEIPIDDLLDKKNIYIEEINFENETHFIPYFLLKNEKVWGATAMILAEFQSILSNFIGK